MREHKYKAWDKIEKRFVSSIYEDEPFEIYLDGTFLGLSGSNNWLGKERYELVEFTGLHDKEEREVFESDIIQHQYLGVVTATYINAAGGFVLYGGKGSAPFTEMCAPYCEVIGNIYENPELLK